MSQRIRSNPAGLGPRSPRAGGRSWPLLRPAHGQFLESYPRTEPITITKTYPKAMCSFSDAIARIMELASHFIG